MQSIEGCDAVRSFEYLQARSDALARFRGPAQVAAFVARDGSDLGERDRVLRCLVQEVSSKGTARRIAHVLLLVGLWPGLDAIFRKRRHLLRGEIDDLEIEIIDHFTAQVQRVNLRRVACLAATLVLNTEREIVDARIRERTMAAGSDTAMAEAIPAPPPRDPPPASRFGLPQDQSDAEDVAALRRWLERAVGRDADLVVDAVIHRRSRLELAAALGISHAAARKRLERALTRARNAFLLDHQSQPAVTSAFLS
jgi:RNA polymerase sigma-70 factor (ECF subfamily)